MKSVILFGHGSRDPLWRQPMDAVVQRMAQASPQTPVRCAFLELQQPDLAAAATELIAAGASAVRIVPMFLGVGKHAREDLPRLVEVLRSAHPRVRFEVQAAIGEDTRVLDLIAAIAAE